MMNLHIRDNLNPLYNGTWYFSYIMDYCLKMKVNGQYLKISLTDLTRKEECELTPISLNAAYLAFRMDSSWGNLRFHIYPHAESGEILVETWDTDTFIRSEESGPKHPHRQVIHITCEEDEYPEWIESVWKTNLLYDGRRIYIHRIHATEIRIALWYSEEDGSTSYDYIAEVSSSGHTGVNLSIHRPTFRHSPVQEMQLLFDSARQQIRARFNHICRPCHERRKELSFPDAWRD